MVEYFGALLGVDASLQLILPGFRAGADATGPKKGVPYDGKLTKTDGKGKWWEGLDPQDLKEQGFNEGKGKPFAAQDVRFTVGKDGALYAITLGWPEAPLNIAALAEKDGHPKVASVTLLGSKETVQWKQTSTGLSIQPPKVRLQPDYTAAYKLKLR